MKAPNMCMRKECLEITPWNVFIDAWGLGVGEVMQPSWAHIQAMGLIKSILAPDSGPVS